MKGPLFTTSAEVFARPPLVRTGEKISADAVISELRRAGYSDEAPHPAGRGQRSPEPPPFRKAAPAPPSATRSEGPLVTEPRSRIGSFVVKGAELQIHPGPDSYHAAEPAILHFDGGKVADVTDNSGHPLDAYELEPQLVTLLAYGQDRAKRRVVTYSEIPKLLVDAVTSIEDRRFFEHNGINYVRFAESAWANLRSGRYSQGGSTITMQVARMFFLTPDKHIKRKLIEMLIALELEQRFTKQQIFALYANQVDMGQRGSFNIKGLAEASRAYFNKDIQELSLPEAALLAGIIQAPSRLTPYRHPEHALERRNLVLDAMAETGAITLDQAQKAKATPLKLAPLNVEASDAPYFVDLVKDSLSDNYTEAELNAQEDRIYTTLDPDLQRAAAEAVESGVKGLDALVLKQRTRKVKIGSGKAAKTETRILPGPEPQVALVALDPHTGEVLALVGGRNYGASQLNHSMARRPTGSIFKPFVYAAAVNTAVDGQQPVFTSTSTVDDSPGSYTFGDQVYEPRNYKEEYHGLVTARYALAMSLNNATVKLAEQVGYDRIAELAHAAGISSVKPTPAMALGSYDATPVEMSQAYTVFANGGVRVIPTLVKSLRDRRGNILDETKVQMKPVLDPRVAYVMTNMMEGVVNYGLGYSVRRAGFTAPAAGKTGSSHDAWFAGYTSNLLCIVWVGFDDYTDLRLSGAVAAAPIWAEFMKSAVALPQYSDPREFTAPPGVVVLKLDKLTNRIATNSCPDDFSAAFIAGTEPHDTCDQAPGLLNRVGTLLGLTRENPTVVPPPGPANPAAQPGVRPQPAAAAPQPAAAQQNDAEGKKKKGFWGKLAGVFKGDEDKQQSPPPKKPQP
ncbi:MAG: PBP1A family penicillin-binding protein [Acidobacteria bacterium]|nr:PBP1A family penicillin-binding protein [Acidobacteriota bacterium]